MKKVISILLVLVIVISLSACGSEQPTNTVAPSVKYDKADFVGEWIVPNENVIITISAEGNFTTSTIGSKNASTTYGDFTDGALKLRGEVYGADTFTIKEENGVKKLVGGSLVAVWKPDFQADSKKYKIGETSSTDEINVTITSVDFIKKIDANTGNPISSGTGLGAGDGMIFAHISFTVENNSKSVIKIPGTFQFTFNYNDGFLFSTEDGEVCYYKDAGQAFYYKYYSGAGSGAISETSPLVSNKYEVYVPVAEALSTNTTNSLVLTATVPSSNGLQEIIYQIH